MNLEHSLTPFPTTKKSNLWPIPPVSIPFNKLQLTSKYIPCLPNKEALRKVIHRKRIYDLSDFQTIEKIMILQKLRITSAGDLFWQKEDPFNRNSLYIFSTNRNIRHRSTFKLLMVKGAFKAVSLIFTKLYTIHGKVRGDTFRTLFFLL
ncbi:hypothetical protein HZS_5741 [Henneguya salminicola]|nr:hypothetical protein HZS_5741 [Henneguya salminicola]